MALESFHLFPELPEELRREIWEWTFLPRLIPLRCGVERTYKGYPPPFVQEVPPQPYELHPGTAAKQIEYYKVGHARVRKARLRPDLTSAYLTVEEGYAAPSALRVHRESRGWARADGYIAWRMRIGTCWRNIMWNPKKDIVDFFENHNSSLAASGLLLKATPLLSMFVRQFPSETTEVRYLSLPSRYWASNAHLSTTTAWPLIDFISLREMIVVVDQVFESNIVEGLVSPSPHPYGFGWTLPDDLAQNLQAIRDYYEKWWPERHPLPKQPSVRVVMDKTGILGGHDNHVTLRCYPCPALEI